MFAIASFSKSLLSRGCNIPLLETASSIHTTAILERARKGTRERKRKIAVANKKKKEERLRKNPPPIPYKIELMLKSKGLWGDPKPLREKDAEKSFPKDNVYFNEDYAYKRYTLKEAIENWRYLCSPSMYNDPNSLVHVKVEFDMRANKKDRYIDGFTKMIPIVKYYDRQVPDRVVMCFVPNETMKIEALQNGAKMAGGTDLIMDVQKGRVDVAEIDHFLAHEELAKDCRSLNNHLRDKAPSIAQGTIGNDMVKLIQTFAKGMYLQVEKVRPSVGIADEPDYASCHGTIGRLGMDTEDLYTNLTAILENLNENKPKRKDLSGFITRVQVYCKPNDNENLSKNFHFSVIHPEIYDLRVEEQEKVLTEAREEIAENVAKLRK